MNTPGNAPQSLYSCARAQVAACAASVSAGGRSKPDRLAAPDRSRFKITRARFRSACSRARSARSGSTVIAACAASLSTCPNVFPPSRPAIIASALALSVLAEQLQGVVDRPGLGIGQRPVLQQRPDAR